MWSFSWASECTSDHRTSGGWTFPCLQELGRAKPIHRALKLPAPSRKDHTIAMGRPCASCKEKPKYLLNPPQFDLQEDSPDSRLTHLISNKQHEVKCRYPRKLLLLDVCLALSSGLSLVVTALCFRGKGGGDLKVFGRFCFKDKKKKLHTLPSSCCHLKHLCLSFTSNHLAEDMTVLSKLPLKNSILQ